VFPGLMTFHTTRFLDDGSPRIVPLSVLLGMTAIMLVGLLDDVVGIRPHVKVGGQLVAAAALAATDVGVKVAAGVLLPLAHAVGLPIATVNGSDTVMFSIPLPIGIAGLDHIPIDLVYWAGTAVIAMFVLGACNASNLVDGLDGLLSGVTAIANMGLLMIALL